MRLIHTADNHLCDAQYGRSDRGEDFTRAVLDIARLAEEYDVKHILSSGDIFNRKRPSSKNIDDIIKIDKRLRDSDINMHTIQGDHDFCDPSWIKTLARENGLSNISDIGSLVQTLNSAEEKLTVFGAPAPCLPAEKFRRLSADWPEADILMYHGPVREFAAYPTTDEDLALEDLPTDKYRVIALGDLHACNYRYVDNCLVGYPGPSEYCSANEKPDKTVTLLDFEEGNDRVSYTTLPLNTRMVIQKVVKTESDLKDLLAEAKVNKDKNPIIHIWYDSDIPDVFVRICSVVNPRKSIVRTVPVPSDIIDTKLENGSLQATDARPQMRKPADFVSKFAKPESPVYTLLQDLCNPEADPATLINNYIETRLNSHDEDHF